MGRKIYTDKFRASAVVMLEAAGYAGDRQKNKPGALKQVSKHLSVPERTLSRWFRAENNPPPDILVTEKKGDLVAMIDEELEGIFGEMPTARPDASYRDMGTVAGILIDKKQLLTGEPTENNDVTIRVVNDR